MESPSHNPVQIIIIAFSNYLLGQKWKEKKNTLPVVFCSLCSHRHKFPYACREGDQIVDPSPSYRRSHIHTFKFSNKFSPFFSLVNAGWCYNNVWIICIRYMYIINKKFNSKPFSDARGNHCHWLITQCKSS